MDNRPIGVFDSGLGGITSVKRLMEVLPGEDIIYLGDTGRVPYGSRSRETIVKYARQDMAFLKSFDIKAIVIACNTVSTATDPQELNGEYHVPVYEVATAPAKKAAASTKNGKIGVIGTNATIRSGAYDREIRRHLPQAEVFSKACPLFVPLVENGRIHTGDKVIEQVVAEYLEELRESGIDTLILGCTHYPLLKSVISAYMGAGVTLVDSGAETAEQVARELSASDMLASPGRCGTYKYYVTDDTAGFSQIASLFLETDVCGEVEQVSLDNF